MPVLSTLVSHGPEDSSRVAAVLRLLAPLGVRPWIDPTRHSDTDPPVPLAAQLEQARKNPRCRSMLLFLSEQALKNPWPQNELLAALEQLPPDWRLLAVALDPIEPSALPGHVHQALSHHAPRWDRLYLDARQPGFAPQLAQAVLGASGLDRIQDLVLHLGHRLSDRQPRIPAAWKELPTLDIRLDYPRGSEEFCPSPTQWKEISEGLAFLRLQTLSELQHLRLCGFSPVACAALVGKTWHQQTGVTLEAWDSITRQSWTSAVTPRPARWSPSTSAFLKLRPAFESLPSQPQALLVALLRLAHYEREVQEWNESRSPSPPVLVVQCPEQIPTAEHAHLILSECLGFFDWLQEHYPQLRHLDLIAPVSLPLIALLLHQLSPSVSVQLYDQVSTEDDEQYRFAFRLEPSR